MDVFELRNKLISDYASYVSSFINILDERIREKVEQELQDGLLWPDPLLQLNPSFEPGDRIDDLVDSGVLHPTCRDVFRLKGPDGAGKPMRLHRHQSDAVLAASSGDSYVLTTGTGSGKSLAYIVPIVNDVLRRGSGRGIRAIVVYPMNALANSQFQELEKFLTRGFPQGPPVTFRLYTGQEGEEQRKEIIANPPDILLTNYVMLELLLTRPREKHIVDSARGNLQFLVLDELHTYRGRQGADVALLVRRVREVCENPALQCIGTSATLAGTGTLAEQQEQIADVASRLFGTEVKPERVIGETLQRVTVERDESDPAFQVDLAARISDSTRKPPGDFDGFVSDPLCSWIETTFGLTAEPQSGRLRRATPLSISGPEGAASKLSSHIGVSAERCRSAIEETLLAGYDIPHPETEFPVFAFRLHQFISRGDTVYASLEDPAARIITTQGQQFVPGDRSRVLLPMAFCRECGQEYYTVSQYQDAKAGAKAFRPRRLTDQSSEEDDETGFLYQNPDNPWPSEPDELLTRLPEDWLETVGDVRRLRQARRKWLPQEVYIDPLARQNDSGSRYHFVTTPFRFCLNCGVSYAGRQRSDYGKLASLSSEGRSTATSILSLGTLRALRSDDSLEPKARKLLSFTDNRQDASLQAGHFNDFVEVGLLRAALFKAVESAGTSGQRYDTLPERVFTALHLPIELYANDPTVRFLARADTDRAFREVLAYRVYQDLRRGWRVTSPNLEQCGLLEIDYASLDELCEAQEVWAELHPALADAAPEDRAKICRTLLDFLQRELAVRVDYLDPVYQERIQQASSQRLISPWAIDENETMAHSLIAYPRSRGGDRRDDGVFVSGRSGFGLYLRSAGVLPRYTEQLTVIETEKIIVQLFESLRVAGLVQMVREPVNVEDMPGYQVPASALIWRAGDGERSYVDPIRVPQPSQVGSRPNRFFVDYYKNVAPTLQGLEAREHTAQVPNDERQKREARFRTAQLPILYCSPTMELGVDISQLNVVNMRNVPPTPANYAQRSGRAGRSGQPALVFTYCTTGSPHDQYFFDRPERMVAGEVSPPRLDLANEDLVRAHVYAVWLAESGLSLESSLRDVLDVEGENPTLGLQTQVREALESSHAKQRAANRLQAIFTSFEDDLRHASWYSENWLSNALAQVEDRFEQACERWRGLYRAAMSQREVQNRIIGDASRSQPDKRQAQRLRREAEAQLDLLLSNDSLFQSDFYSYRYFASEGFLPGYNFPRLPLSAYIPGRRHGADDRDEFLNRPRFLAISEFGPRSIIYHEGSRYIVNRVILPVEDRVEDRIATRAVKLCPRCGHLHPIIDGESDPDKCEQCEAYLDSPLRQLLRMQNVSTKRRDRISSDEEERVRMGYDLITGVRFERNGRRNIQIVDVIGENNEPILRLTYGSAATLWRINLGWRRRKDKEITGFVLDTERGYWSRNETAVEDDPDDPMSESKQRVVPYVEDRRNCLVIEPRVSLSLDQMASLQPALKGAIQVLYQVEDNELAAEPLPTRDERNFILIYESAEGGAGVLRQLFEDAGAIERVAREALRICHFDPFSGEDLRRSPRSREDCEAACYDCLMSYYNQMDHLLLDRMLIKDLLLRLTQSRTQLVVNGEPDGDRLVRLKRLCDSNLEREWLDFIDQRGYRLPDEAQRLFAECHTRVDFYYPSHYVVVEIDGPNHDLPEKAAGDREIEDCFFERGISVVRFRYDNKGHWGKICQDYAHVFGARA